MATTKAAVAAMAASVRSVTSAASAASVVAMDCQPLVAAASIPSTSIACLSIQVFIPIVVAFISLK